MTLRKTLALTTALWMAVPMAAAAQTDAHETVRGVLDQYGYDVAQVENLTNAEVAEIYLAATSDDSEDVRMILSAMDLPENADMMPVGFQRTSMVDDRVRDVLSANDYDPAVIDFMSNGEIAQIYVAASAGNNPDLSTQLAAMNLPGSGDMSGSLGTSYDTGSNIERVVADRMMTMGYTQAQIDALDDDGIAEVYLALTSDDTEAVRNAIEGALES